MTKQHRFFTLCLLGRPLTAGERALVESIFQNAVDTDKVRILGRAYWPGLPGQGAMAPAGRIYFPRRSYRADFSQADVSTRSWFIHEMVHVWQHQMRYRLRWQGLLLFLQGGYYRARAYHYDREKVHPFADYNFEQQAQIVAHYYHDLACNGSCAPFYTQALVDFLQNPADPDLLPRRA